MSSVKSWTNQRLADQARSLLGRTTGFRDCSAALLDDLAALGTLKKLPRGNFVVRRGDSAPYAAMLVEGLLEASVMHHDGHRHLVALLVPGDINGLIGMIDGQPHISDIVARSDSALMLFHYDALRQLREREPALVRACEHYIAFRSRLLYERVAADPAQPLEKRIARMLQIMSLLRGHPLGPVIELDVKLSQTDIADWLGMSRQRVNFVLKQLEADGLIALRYSALTILDPARLQALARD